MTIRFTRITSAHGALTKRIFLDENGQLQKSAVSQLYRGQYQVDSIATLADLAPLLEAATSDTAFTYGVPDQPAGMLVREDDLHLNPSAIARTRNFFSWASGPGILMIDDDSGAQVGDFAGFLRASVPFLDDVEMLVRPSSSSWIKNDETGDWVREEVNRRAYAIVSEAVMIPEVGKLVEAYLWLAGHGYYDVSRSGRLLKRCPADTSVWQPERLDFVGGAVCTAPLSQGILRAKLSLGKRAWIDAEQLPQLDDRQLALIQKKEQQAGLRVQQEQRDKRKAYLDEQTERLVMRGAAPQTAKAAVQAAMEGQTLGGEFTLTLQDGTELSVAELLAEPQKFHAKRCHDPLEPDYRDDPRVAYISLINGSQPYIYSHAHGGCRYLLVKQAKTIEIVHGQAARTTDEIALQLAGERILYERGQVLVTVQPSGQTCEVNAAAAKYLAGTHCNLRRFDRRDKSLKPADLPDVIAQLLLTRAGHGVFPRLTGVITAPTMTAKGRLISDPGFDPDTGLLFITSGESQLPAIAVHPDKDALQAAFEQLWHPFKDFPFDGEDSHSAMVAALLTAAVRPGLPTAPGFGFDAPTAGSGKTKLAQCVAALATGVNEPLLPPPSDDEETRKKISTAVLASKQVVIFDNIEAQLKSPVLAAFLTASTWSDRMLGGNTKIEAENRVLLLLTGNNLAPVGDLIRRLLMIRIDPKVEASEAWKREFTVEPLDYVIRNRQRMVAAALTLLSGFVAAGMPRLGTGRLASFEQWDDLVRQSVVWLGSQGIGSLVDPINRLNDAAANDPETARLGTLASTWFGEFGSTPKSLKEVMQSGKLTDVLREAVEYRGVINAKLLAAYLRKRQGKVVNGYRFEKVGGRAHTWLWRVVQVTASGGGYGGFGGLVSAHPPININFPSAIFGGVAEIDPPKPPNPPPGDTSPAANGADQQRAGAGA